MLSKEGLQKYKAFQDENIYILFVWGVKLAGKLKVVFLFRIVLN